MEKPRSKSKSRGSNLTSIPNTIKLSMLNSGLLSFGKDFFTTSIDLIIFFKLLEKIKLEARDEKNSISQTIPSVPVHLDVFRKLCEQRRKFPVLYKLEFSTAAKVETNTHRHAMRRNNHSKNQNPKCIPFDYNRIVLEKVPGVPDSDYINASYVDVSIFFLIYILRISRDLLPLFNQIV